MRRCALLPSARTLTDLQLVFPMHLSWHSNSSTTVTVSMTWPSKTWSKSKQKSKFYNCKLKTLNIEGKKEEPLNLQVTTHQLEFQKRFHRSLCLPPQITFLWECWEMQRPTELVMSLPSKGLWCVSYYSSSKLRRDTRFDTSIIFLCEFGSKRINFYAKPCLSIINNRSI